MHKSFKTDCAQASVVYFTKEISPEALMKLYQKLGRQAQGRVAAKLSTGEAGNNNYLKPALIKDLVQSVCCHVCKELFLCVLLSVVAEFHLDEQSAV